MFKLDLEKAEEPEINLPTSRLPLWLRWYKINLQCGRPGFNPWVGKIPWRRERLPTPVFWLGEFHGLYSLWGLKKLDMTESLHFHYIIQKAGEFQNNIYFCFIDYAKVFDCVDHNKLWTILKAMGIPDLLTCLLRNLYAVQETTVRTGHGTMD